MRHYQGCTHYGVYCRFRTLSTATLHPKRLGALGYIPRAQMRGCASPFGPIMEWLPKSKTPLPLSKVVNQLTGTGSSVVAARSIALESRE